MRNVPLLAAALLLAGCVRAAPIPRPDPPTPTATILPTPTPTAAPTPLATPAPKPVPVYRPRRVLRGVNPAWGPVDWSFDNAWFAFWEILDAPPLGVGGGETMARPGFFHVASGRTCLHDELAGPYLSRFGRVVTLFWEPDGQATVGVGGRWFRGQPCGTFAPIDPIANTTEIEVDISPDGRYRALTVFRTTTPSAETTITDLQTGDDVVVLEWWPSVRPEVASWVGSRGYLLHGSGDRGPLLVSLPGGEAVAVVPELFGFDLPPAQRHEFRVYGAENRATGDLHLLLAYEGNRPAPPLLLYHGESGDVETLPFTAAHRVRAGSEARAGFSPDGEYLLLRAVFGAPSGGNGLWARPVDGERADVFEASAWMGALVSDGARRVAVDDVPEGRRVDVLELPAGEVLQQWQTDPYQLLAVSWSPDGAVLLLHGSRAASRDYVPPEDRFGTFLANVDYPVLGPH